MAENDDDELLSFVSDLDPSDMLVVRDMLRSVYSSSAGDTAKAMRIGNEALADAILKLAECLRMALLTIEGLDQEELCPIVWADDDPPPAFVPLTGATVRMLTGDLTVAAFPSLQDRHFLAPDFVEVWRKEIATDPFFSPIFKGRCHGGQRGRL